MALGTMVADADVGEDGEKLSVISWAASLVQYIMHVSVVFLVCACMFTSSRDLVHIGAWHKAVPDSCFMKQRDMQNTF